MKFEIKYNNTFKDIQIFHNFFSHISPYQFKFLLLIKFGIPAIWFLLKTIPNLKTDQKFGELFLFILIFSICYFVIPKLIQRSLYRSLLSNYKKGKYNQIIQDHTIIVDNNKIADETNLNKFTFEWKEILKIRFDKFNIYIFLNKKSAFIIPRRSFENEKYQKVFIKYCQKQLQKTRNQETNIHIKKN